jgi:hypothetical protein
MSKRKRPQSIGGQFGPRLIEMLESPAYRALSLSARRVLDRIEVELAHHGGRDNGGLPVTYDDFEHYGIDRHLIAPAIREAVALKFLEITKPGRAGNAEHRAPNLFRLTYRHTKREEPSHDWRRVATAEQAAKLAREARAPVHRKKTKLQWGFLPNPVGETPTETIVAKPPLQAIVAKPPLLSISRGGGFRVGNLFQSATRSICRCGERLGDADVSAPPASRAWAGSSIRVGARAAWVARTGPQALPCSWSQEADLGEALVALAAGIPATARSPPQVLECRP